ncbi:endolytic transglycosylase MltG [Ammoniphilus sp. 3BR4]|uniref:endolytic transglycosylase MltG n=1 Tax=Ammoniphilus sp. 3BR4 TaxID=3158265 RepID=UPI003467A09F
MSKIIKLFMLFLILAVGGSAAGYFYYQDTLKPPEAGAPVVVEIPPGSSTQKIANILEENQIIRNSKSFAFYVKQSGKSNQLKAGQYEFTPGETVEDILNRMVEGDVYANTFQFTIPEGWTIAQIASYLAEKGWVNKDKFLAEANEAEFPYEFIGDIPQDKSMTYRLEGYLFPKTYEMKEGATEYEILDRMLAQFQKEWDPSWNEALKKRGMTIHEAVTLASIVEREVVVEAERPRVAGVYYNRLGQDILLQADATVQYAMGKQKDIVTYKDLELDHPYNTYKVKGLPPGPIAAPGKQSLQSVVEPESHKYLFYVTKKDGSGEHFFSETYNQHLKNIALSKRSQK